MFWGFGCERDSRIGLHMFLAEAYSLTTVCSCTNLIAWWIFLDASNAWIGRICWRNTANKKH